MLTESKELKKILKLQGEIMQVKCLSIQPPWSYLIAFGIKDVENRTWTTAYRGEIYIHSSGKEINGLIAPEFFSNMKEYKKLLPVHAEFVNYRDKDEPGKEYQYINLDETRKIVSLKEDVDPEIYTEYQLLKYNYNDVMRSKAIIGKFELVDIIKDSDAKWGEKGNFHWIVKNPELFEKPITHVKGKLGLFDYNL